LCNLTGRVFLYEVEQLADKSKERSKRFRRDLQHYLYLRDQLPPMPWFKPGRNHNNSSTQKSVDQKKINICDERYNILREVLMKSAKNASRWILEYFLSVESVVVSNPNYFRALLKNWESDPCIDGGSYKKAITNVSCTLYGCYMDHGNSTL